MNISIYTNIGSFSNHLKSLDKPPYSKFRISYLNKINEKVQTANLITAGMQDVAASINDQALTFARNFVKDVFIPTMPKMSLENLINDIKTLSTNRNPKNRYAQLTNITQFNNLIELLSLALINCLFLYYRDTLCDENNAAKRGKNTAVRILNDVKKEKLKIDKTWNLQQRFKYLFEQTINQNYISKNIKNRGGEVEFSDKDYTTILIISLAQLLNLPINDYVKCFLLRNQQESVDAILAFFREQKNEMEKHLNQSSLTISTEEASKKETYTFVEKNSVTGSKQIKTIPPIRYIDLEALTVNIKENTIKIVDFANRYQRSSWTCLDTLDIGHQILSFIQLSDERLAIGYVDGTISLWNLNKRLCEQTFTGHKDSIYALTMLPDGRLASGSRDRTVKVWDLKTGQCAQTFIGHTNGIRALTVLQNDCLASGSKDYTIKMWSLKTGKCKQTFTGHTNRVWALTVLPDQRLASGSSDGSIKVWSLKTGKCEETLIGHTSYVHALMALPDGRLASGSWDKTIKVWSLKTGKCEQTLTGHSKGVHTLMYLPHGRLASGSYDAEIKVWNLETRLVEQTLTGHTGTVWALMVLSCGRLVSGSSDKTIKVWDTPHFIEECEILPCLNALQTNQSVITLNLSYLKRADETTSRLSTTLSQLIQHNPSLTLLILTGITFIDSEQETLLDATSKRNDLTIIWDHSTTQALLNKIETSRLNNDAVFDSRAKKAITQLLNQHFAKERLIKSYEDKITSYKPLGNRLSLQSLSFNLQLTSKPSNTNKLPVNNLTLKHLFPSPTKQSKKIAIVGQAGIGKSTLIYSLLNDWLSNIKSKPLSQDFQIVFFISTRQLTESRYPRKNSGSSGHYTLAKIIMMECFKSPLDIPSEQERAKCETFIQQCLTFYPDRVCFLIDGLNELPPSKNKTVTYLQKLLEKALHNPRYNILATTRHHFAETQPFDDCYTMQTLKREHICTSIEQFFNKETTDPETSNESLSKKCITFLDNHPLLMKLVQTPIYFGLFCKSYSSLENTKLPESAVSLILHQTFMNLAFESICDLNRNKIRSLLEKFAFNTLLQDQLVFDHKKDLSQLTKDTHLGIKNIEEYLKKLPFIKVIQRTSDSSDDLYTFTLHSFQEYLSACYLVNNINTGISVEFFRYHKFNPRYQHFIALVVGCCALEGKPLLTKCYEKILSEPRDMYGFYEALLIINSFAKLSKAQVEELPNYEEISKCISPWIKKEIVEYLHVENRYSSLIEAMKHCLWVFNLDTITTFFSSKFEKPTDEQKLKLRALFDKLGLSQDLEHKDHEVYKLYYLEDTQQTILDEKLTRIQANKPIATQIVTITGDGGIRKSKKKIDPKPVQIATVDNPPPTVTAPAIFQDILQNPLHLAEKINQILDTTKNFNKLEQLEQLRSTLLTSKFQKQLPDFREKKEFIDSLKNLINYLQDYSQKHFAKTNTEMLTGNSVKAISLILKLLAQLEVSKCSTINKEQKKDLFKVLKQITKISIQAFIKSYEELLNSLLWLFSNNTERKYYFNLDMQRTLLKLLGKPNKSDTLNEKNTIQLKLIIIKWVLDNLSKEDLNANYRCIINEIKIQYQIHMEKNGPDEFATYIDAANMEKISHYYRWLNKQISTNSLSTNEKQIYVSEKNYFFLFILSLAKSGKSSAYILRYLLEICMTLYDNRELYNLAKFYLSIYSVANLLPTLNKDALSYVFKQYDTFLKSTPLSSLIYQYNETRWTPYLGFIIKKITMCQQAIYKNIINDEINKYVTFENGFRRQFNFLNATIEKILCKNKLKSIDYVSKLNEMDSIERMTFFLENEGDIYRIFRDDVSYVKENILGKGSFSIVYSGEYQSMSVAVKELMPHSALEAFKNELEILKLANHENIVNFYGLVYKDEMPNSFVLEFISGGTLRTFLECNDSNNENWNVKLKIAVGVGKGLQYLHSLSILHLDLYWENVLLTKNKYVPKLCDFGLSRILNKDNNIKDLALPEAFEKHNPRYVAPEIIRGIDRVDTCSREIDIYSYGLILWQLSSKTRPFDKVKDDDIFSLCNIHDEKIDGRTPDNDNVIPDECPEYLKPIIERSWSCRPSERPTAREIVAELENELNVKYILSD